MSISLCITCYDGDVGMLPALLTIFQQQTVHPDEIIISASGVSIDDIKVPESILINNTEVDIKIVCEKNRHYQSKARNLGAAASSSTYVMFFDVDDIPHNRKIELTKKFIKGHDFLLHSHHRDLRDINRSIVHDSMIETTTRFSLNSGCTNICVYHPHFRKRKDLKVHHAHITVKTEIFKQLKFNESSSYYRKEDGKFCQDLVSNNYSGIYLKVPLVYYLW